MTVSRVTTHHAACHESFLCVSAVVTDR